MGAVRAVLSEVLLLALQYYGGMSKVVHDMVNIFVDAVVHITINDIQEVLHVPQQHVHNAELKAKVM
jgi:hypothetical protein